MRPPESSLRRQMETALAIFARKDLRDQQTEVPNLDDSGCPIQRLQGSQVQGLVCYSR